LRQALEKFRILPSDAVGPGPVVQEQMVQDAHTPGKLQAGQSQVNQSKKSEK
jgi:hypothetical protein